MKKLTNTTQPLFVTLLAVATLCAAPVLYAQEAGDPGPAATAKGFPSPQEVVSRLQAKLSLSAEQTSALTPIIASRQEKLKALLADSSARPLKRRREMRSIVTESDKQINALLSPEQQKQYAEIEKQMQEEFKQRMKERRDAGAG